MFADYLVVTQRYAEKCEVSQRNISIKLISSIYNSFF